MYKKSYPKRRHIAEFIAVDVGDNITKALNIIIKIETIERDILECSRYLDYLKKTSILSNQINDYLSHNEINDNLLIDENLTNAHALLTIVQLEISIILKSLHYSRCIPEEKIIIKQGILLIYEAIKSLNRFGKTFKSYSKVNADLKKSYSIYLLAINKFKTRIDYGGNFELIRNNIVGHIDTDYINYSNIVAKINSEQELENLISYRFITKNLNEYITKCFKTTM